MIRSSSLAILAAALAATGSALPALGQGTVVIGGGSGAATIEVGSAFAPDGHPMAPISVHDQGRRLLFYGQKATDDQIITLRPPKGMEGPPPAARPAAPVIWPRTVPRLAAPATPPPAPMLARAPTPAPTLPAATRATPPAATPPPFPPLSSTPAPPPPSGARTTAAPAPSPPPPAAVGTREQPAPRRTVALPPLGGMLDSFTFEAGQENLTEDQKARLAALARQLRGKEGQVVLTSYASGGGNRNQAHKFAFTRAMHARAQLIGERLSKGRIEVRTLGEPRDGSRADRLDIVLRQVRQ